MLFFPTSEKKEKKGVGANQLDEKTKGGTIDTIK
jgi:hypothetical protein